MQIVQKKNIQKIPLQCDDILEAHKVELPEKIILEICENDIVNETNEKVSDGEIFITNFIDGGIKLRGEITGYINNESFSTGFILDQKENCSLIGWHYSDEEKITIEFLALLLTGEEIPLLKRDIPFNTRAKHLLFYS
ncbi:MAG: hypothetical protein INQ03_23585 [Candidatus Heimdallarchaeota archaeon]|nr:hypothetical protein [Candidatus Heimdallarchaeota archaeon]